MAKYRNGKKMDPAVMTMTFATPDTVGGNYTIDLSQCASLMNRRFYRQGINWVVESIKFSSSTTGSIVVSKLPTTWVAYQAWKKAFAAWNDQQKAALEESGAESARARFSDFKIHMDATHVTAGFGANLLPIDASGNPYAPGEWEASNIVLPNATLDASGSRVDPKEQLLHMVGANELVGGTSRGIIEGYADSRAYPQSPDPVSADLDSYNNWMARMSDVGNEQNEVLDNATDVNDNLPYPQVDYPGGQTQAPGLDYYDIVTIYSSNATNGIGTQKGRGGIFPAGLMRINWTPEAAANLLIQVHLVPGDHRGYLCEPMGDV